MTLEERLRAAPVVPLVQASDPKVAVRTARSLADGGLSVIEVVLRTPEALECLAEVARELPDALVGAGTVLSEEQATAALAAGARFIVSPGLDRDVVRKALDNDAAVLPGVATPTEAQAAHNLGVRVVKFFPATLAGGVPMLKALGAVFRNLRFIPTGGVTAANLGEFLALDAVLACGGSWLTPQAAIDAGDYDAITGLAREAVGIARGARGPVHG